MNFKLIGLQDIVVACKVARKLPVYNSCNVNEQAWKWNQSFLVKELKKKKINVPTDMK